MRGWDSATRGILELEVSARGLEDGRRASEKGCRDEVFVIAPR
jgi:hypothetical protein